MNGVQMSLKKYRQTVEHMAPPIMPSELPKIKMDISGMTAYAKKVGKQLNELTKEERNRFIKGDYETFYKENVRRITSTGKGH